LLETRHVTPFGDQGLVYDRLAERGHEIVRDEYFRSSVCGW
jgi:hypothetical protein